MTAAPYTSRTYDTTTSPNLDALEEWQRDLHWALTTLERHRTDYERYRDYFDGAHRLMFATTEYQKAFKQLLEGLRANLCPRVVYALTDRLEIEQFEPHAGGTDVDAAAAWELWEGQGLADTASRVHDWAVALGDMYVRVWQDQDGVPRIYPESPLHVCHKHDEERPEVVTLAAKLWRDGKRHKLYLYYPDRIEKYITSNDNAGNGVPLKWQSFERYEVDDPATGLTEPWPLRHDFGAVPIVHFPFQPNTHDAGKSELKDVIPIQDALNKALADQVVATEFGAWAQRVIIGLEPLPENERLKVAIDRLITIDDPNAKIGEWSAVDLEKYNKTIMAYAQLIAIIKGIPPHYLFLSGDFPSGESLKTAEAALVKRVEKTQRTFGSSWADVLRLALRMREPAIADARLAPVWASAETRDETALVQRLAIEVRDLGLSRKEALTQRGYTDTEIATILTDRDRDDVATVARTGALFDQT